MSVEFVIMGMLGVLGLVYLAFNPKVGLLLFAAIAPVSNLAETGGFRLEFVLGPIILLGTVFGIGHRYEWPSKKVAVIALVLLYWLIYAFISGWFDGFPLFLSSTGALSVCVALAIVFRKQNDLELWILTLASALTAFNVIAVVLIFFAPGLAELIFMSSREGVRMIGPYENPNHFGGAQLLVLGPMAYFAFASRYKLWRWLAVIALILAFVAALASQSRSAIGGMFLATMLLGMILAVRSGHNVRNSLVMVVLGAAMVGLYISVPQEVMGFQLKRVAEGSGGIYALNVEEAGSRFWLIENGLEALEIHPEGIGFNKRQSARIGDLTGTYKVPHNFIVSILLNYGIVGGIVVNAIAMLPIFVVGYLLLANKIDGYAMPVFLACAYAGFLLHNMFHTNIYWVHVWMYWTVCMLGIQHARELNWWHRSQVSPVSQV